MLTTFDRYLLNRFVQVFVVFFISTFGLFVVIDCFTNVDAFQEGSSGSLDSLQRIATYYGVHTSEFFELSAPIIAVLSVIIVLALLQKGGEIAPLLAAGVPTYRLAKPLIIGTIAINAMLIFNQEVIIPSLASELQAPRGGNDQRWQSVEPAYDANLINIDGNRLYPTSRRLHECRLTLRPPVLAHELTTLNGRDAVYYEPKANRPGGWLVKGVSADFDIERLTDEGRRLIIPMKEPGTLFVVSRLGFDQLSNRSQSYKLVSSSQLMTRLKTASAGPMPTHGQNVHLHFRFTRPLLNVAMVIATIPIILRRDSRSLIGNMVLCSCMMSVLYIAAQASLYLGVAGIVQSDLAAWAPVMASGGTAAWLSGWIRT